MILLVSDLGWEDAIGARGLAIRGDVSAAGLRRLARREPDRNAKARMLAIAGVLEGLPRAGAARLAGMERRALRDAVVRYNAEGLAGLRDRALSRQEARPAHPNADPVPRDVFAKGSCKKPSITRAPRVPASA